MTTDRDDAATRRYREASAELDERPSAAARAAILAAAARHVEAKPRAADAPRVSHRRRWPLAAAAAVLLSSLAVMMAQRTAEEMPTFTAPAGSQDRAPAASVPPAPVPSVAIDQRQDSPPPPPTAAAEPQVSGKNAVGEAPGAGTVAPGVRLKKSAPDGATDERANVASTVPERRDEPTVAADTAKSRAPAQGERETSSAEARRALPAAPPQPSAAVPVPAEAVTGRSARDAAGAEPAPAYRAARKELAPAAAPAVRGAVGEEALRDFERSAQDWLDRIVKLRGEGRHADADAELKRFRERYPEVQVPSAALPPAAPVTGTR